MFLYVDCAVNITGEKLIMLRATDDKNFCKFISTSQAHELIKDLKFAVNNVKVPEIQTSFCHSDSSTKTRVSMLLK